MINLKLCVFDISEQERAALHAAVIKCVSKQKNFNASPEFGHYFLTVYDVESEKAFSELQALLTPLVSKYFYQFWAYQNSGASLKIGDCFAPSDCFTVVGVGNTPA